MLELGELIRFVPEQEYDFWNNTSFYIDEETLPVFRVHQISYNTKKKTYRLAVENVEKPGYIDYISSHESRIKRVAAFKDGTPVRKIQKE